MSEIDKHGNLINLPQFKIHGEKRRLLKKKRDKIKSLLKAFWFQVDINQVYGLQIPKEKLDEEYNNLKLDLFEIEKMLKVPFL